MTRSICLSITASALAWSAPASASVPRSDSVVTPVSRPPGYHLVWHDEFDRDGAPDPGKWGFERGFVRNDEDQWYQRANVRVSNGLLVIEARRANLPNPAYNSAQVRPAFRHRHTISITSGSVTTNGLASWTYGRFEIRARVATEQGLWPALWFVGDHGHWPASGEIDLFEYYRGRVLANFGWASPVSGKPIWKSVRTPVGALNCKEEWSRQFHLWIMDWDARRITLSLDGRELNRLDLSQVRNQDKSGIDNPFQHPQHLTMNLALGGLNGGSTRVTPMPSRFEIDYVRIYQRTVPSP